MNIRPLVSLSAILTSGIWGLAHAQDGGAGLEEVVVTAERRVTNLQSTPISITAISSEQLDAISAVGLQDLQGFIPNFSISEDGAYGRSNPQFNIRGVGAGTVTAGVVTERPVGLYIDGLFFPRVQGSLLNVLDAQSIEVLRGPQGTLFGRNTTGGAVVYKSKTPTEESSGQLKLRAGNFGELRIQGDVNLALSDTVFLRGAYANTTQDGYVERGNIDLGNIDDEVGRLQMRIVPSEAFTLDLAATIANTESNGDARVLSEFLYNDQTAPGRHFSAVSQLLVDVGEPPLVENDPRLISSGYDAPSFCLWDDVNPLTFSPRCETNLDAQMQVYSANAKWLVNDSFSLASITGHIKGDQESTNDWVWTGAYRRPFEFEYKTFSQELQLNYDTDRLNVVAGAIYFNEEGSEREITDEIRVVGSVPEVADIDGVRAGGSWRRRDGEYQIDTDSIGVFLQGTYNLTEKFDVTAGVRQSWDDKEVTIINRPTPQDPDERTGTGDESWSNFDWRIAAQYQFTDDFMLYGSVTDAYKAGIADDASLEFSPTQNPNNSILFIPPENALGYELGIRSEWFDNRFRANLTVFRTEYTDRQGRIGTTLPSGEIVLSTVNLGDVEYQGLEGELTFAATENLTLNAAFGLLDYELVEDPDNVLSNVPEETFTIGARHDKDIQWGSISTSLNYAWTGETFGRNNALPDATRGLRQAINPSWGKLNLRVVAMPTNEKWSVAAYVANALDEYYSTTSSAQTFHIGGNGTEGRQIVRNRFLGRPRSYGLEFTMNF